MKYVQRRAGRYEFRFPLPDDLAGKAVPFGSPASLQPLINTATKCFKRELVRSLKTNEAALAERKALAEIAAAHELIDAARAFLKDGPAASIAPNQIEALAIAQEGLMLRGDEALRSRGLGLNPTFERSPHAEGGLSDTDLDLYAFAIKFLDQERRAELARMRPGEDVAAQVNKAVREAGLDLAPDDPSWRQLELAFLRAQRRAFDGITARLNGEDVPSPPPPPPPSPVIGAAKGLTISTALERWKDGGGRGARKPREDSVFEASRAVQRFIEMHGDLPIVDISKAQARAFRDGLAALPKALPHKLLRLPLPELLKRDLSKYPARSAQTVNKTLALLGGILTRAERDGYFDALGGWTNPFHVAFEINTKDKEPYEPFSTAELVQLFQSPVFAHGKRPLGGGAEAAYWFPVVALYSGARRTEIAQLRLCDVRQSVEGIWFFDFNDQGEGQSLKNSSSMRSVPVHPELIRLGLLAHHASRATRNPPEGPLWSAFTPPIATRTKAWSKWFGRYLGIHVVDDPAKTFHSFRHTFKRACREAGLSEEIHHALTGHAGGGVGRSYGRERREDGSLDRGISMRRLHAELSRVSYDLPT